MFDIGFWELALISIIGLLVLGPERLPVAVRKSMQLVRTVKGTATALTSELYQELNVHELHQDLKTAEQLGRDNLPEDLQASVETLQQAAASVTRPYAKPTEQTETASSNNIVSESSATKICPSQKNSEIQ